MDEPSLKNLLPCWDRGEGRLAPSYTEVLARARGSKRQALIAVIRLVMLRGLPLILTAENWRQSDRERAVGVLGLLFDGVGNLFGHHYGKAAWETAGLRV
jgi:ABC-type transport system involved in cytochrome c biogenesis permease subunit